MSILLKRFCREPYGPGFPFQSTFKSDNWQ